MSEQQPRRRWPRTRHALRAAWRTIVFGLAVVGEAYMPTGHYPVHRAPGSSTPDPALGRDSPRPVPEPAVPPNRSA